MVLIKYDFAICRARRNKWKKRNISIEKCQMGLKTYCFCHVEDCQNMILVGEKSISVHRNVVVENRHHVREVVEAFLLKHLIQELKNFPHVF